MPKKHFLTIFFALVFSLLFLSVIYLMLGNKNVPLTEILVNKMVLQLRFPRLISLYLTGFLLSVSGFIVQIMTRNPIAEMATLGISGGSSLALSLILTLGWSTNDGISVLVSSLGAFIALAVVMLLTARTHFQPLKVVLVGTSVGLFATSLASSLTSVSYTHLDVYKRQDKNNKVYKEVVKAYEQKNIADTIKKEYPDGGELPAWNLKL